MTKIELEKLIIKEAKKQCKEIGRMAENNPEADGGRFAAGQRTGVIYFMEALLNKINEIS